MVTHFFYFFNKLYGGEDLNAPHTYLRHTSPTTYIKGGVICFSIVAIVDTHIRLPL